MGVLPRIWRDPLAFFQEVAAECGGVARVGLGKYVLHLISDPDTIQRILLDDGTHFWKGAGLAAAEHVMGKGLATSEGELWRTQRRLMQPSFQPKRVELLRDTLAGAVEELVDGWAAHAGTPFDVSAHLDRLSQRAIFQTMFGSDVSVEEARRLAAAVAEANSFINHAAWRFLPIPESWPTPRNLRFKRALATLDEAIYRLIRARRAAAEPGDDLLGRLVGARDEGDEGMSDRQIRDEVVTQFVAGHETTTNSLVWSSLLLTQHPQICDALADDEQFELAGRFVQESLRLYPPSWVLVRTPYQDTQLGGYAVPKDATLLISQWVVHRRADLWPEPTRFDPGRWLPERSEGQHRFAYFPFGGGRRTCIGNHFALLLLKLAVSRIAQRFRLERVGAPPRPQPQITLRPGGPLRVKLSAR